MADRAEFVPLSPMIRCGFAVSMLVPALDDGVLI
jgi:hypothetical protein